MSQEHLPYKIEKSAIVTIIGIILLFSTAIIVTLISPAFLDQSWLEPSSSYMVQMYEISDPNFYISGQKSSLSEFQAVHHLKQDETLLAFKESNLTKIISKPELQAYITRVDDPKLKLTSRLLLLRKVNPETLELYEPGKTEAFALASTDKILEDWVDQNFEIIDPKADWHSSSGVIYVENPIEYKVSFVKFDDRIEHRYDPESGVPIKDVEELKNTFGFRSRKELIANGEHTYAIEGCWYCHTDQTRTLVQDVVLNGSDSFPAPPSSANEYIYQKITFPGTRRIGPDLSRVGIKRPGRDWHKSHFWSPKLESKGSVMPAFRHFFDDDPRGSGKSVAGIPNFQFESIYQYLMTKGTRITPPSKAWWLGKDPVETLEIIEGRKVVK